ncbi:glutathione S-transferase N-terminal domain-containing protein [Rhodoligotrophos defluvii]|uniref:glutathione S-transferase N-terminal domain-containing protein n=1 Tax=Rhodoligotrophos defluvii TaxID=2561934 RepID=UPI0010C93C22|nr:glutathione S-transferase N-terminal domain-containing protein [Rhodoligotrophos defluvii]
MKLYMHPGACSLSPHIVCRELGIPIELINVDRATHRTSDGEDFIRINANGYVPVLMLDNGEKLTEGPAIVQYLAELHPEGGLLPSSGTIERARVQSWLNFITSELHKPMAMLMMPPYAPAKAALLDHVSKRLTWLSKHMKTPYVTGEAFTVVDAYLFVCLNWSPWNSVELARWPGLQAFMKSVGQRPKVQEALAAEGLGPYGDSGIFYAPVARSEQ